MLGQILRAKVGQKAMDKEHVVFWGGYGTYVLKNQTIQKDV